jgi:hypothetical protein
LLSGALVDYSARGGPYAQAGLLFFGDDTSRAESSSQWRGATLSPVPEPASVALLAAGLAVLAWRRRAGAAG